MVLELLLVVHAFLSNSSEHIVSFPESISFLHIGLLLFLIHRILQLCTILLRLLCLLNFTDLLVLIVGLDLTFDNGSPFIKIATGICRVVPLSTIDHCLHFLAFVFHGFLDTLGVDFKGIYQVVHIDRNISGMKITAT